MRKNIILFLSLIFLISCKKLLNIPKATGFVTYDEVFSNDEEAKSAAAGMYTILSSSGQVDFANAGMTIFCGMSADELEAFILTNQDYFQFQMNSLNATNGSVSKNLWSKAYSAIYSANAIIEGLQSVSGVRDSVKNELTGEAEFIRAFCYFYLINLFGDVPLVTTINYHNTTLLSRTPADQVYDQIVADLKDAKNVYQEISLIITN